MAITNRFTKSRYFIIIIFLISFLICYFYFLIDLYIFPNNFAIPIILLISFAFLIIGIFSIFFCFNHKRSNDHNFNIMLLDENLIKLLLIIFMIFSLFIKPISFSESVVDWSQIGFFNYFRSFSVLFGCLIIPGASLYNIFLYQSKLDEKFNIEPFFIKIVFYPLLSFTFLGTVTFFLDSLGLMREYFEIILFLIIILLYIFDIIVQKFRSNVHFRLRIVEIKISKYSLYIVLMALSIIIIAFGIQFSLKYLLEGDSYVSINYSTYVGRSDTNPFDKFYSYTMYWGEISFILSKLSGIPAININVMLFFFLYLFITSIYLLMKSLLRGSREIYAVLSTILVVSFTELFYINNIQLAPGRESISLLIFDGVLNFRYKSLAFSLTNLSMALFITTAKTSKSLYRKIPVKNEIYLVILSAWFLLQSCLIYFSTLIPVIILITIYVLFSKRKAENLHFYWIFFLFFILTFILFDIFSTFYFSWKFYAYIYSSLGFSKFNFKSYLFLNALISYFLLFSFFILIFLLYRIYIKSYWNLSKKGYQYTPHHKTLFTLASAIFSILLTIQIIFNIGLKVTQDFFLFYLDILFLNISSIGILGLYLSYFLFKKNKQLFYVLISWCLFTIILASILIFIRGVQNPFISPLDIPNDEYYNMVNFFNLIWYYSIIPLSIFTSIGIIKLKKYLIKKIFIKNLNANFRLLLNLIFTSFLIFTTISNLILASMYWYNLPYKMKDEEMQIIGWVEKNVPKNSNFLVDRHNFNNRLDKIAFCNPYIINNEINEAFKPLEWKISNINDYNCTKEFICVLDGRQNITKFTDKNVDGLTSIIINFNSFYNNGSIEFYMRIKDESKRIYFDCSYSGEANAISILIENNGIYYYNKSSYLLITNISSNTWYPMKFNFECTEGNYSGLSKYHWNVLVNGAKFGEFDFTNKISNITHLSFYSSKDDSNYDFYIDDLIVSWLKDAQNLLYTTPIVIDYLKSQNILYFIQSKNENYCRIKSEEISIDVNNELLKKFYNEKLYEYEDLVIYFAYY